MLVKIKEKLISYEQKLWKAGDDLGFGKFFLIKLIRVTYLVIVKIPKERPMLRSAALTFTTMLSLLPMLIMFFGVYGAVTQAGFGSNYSQKVLINSGFEKFVDLTGSKTVLQYKPKVVSIIENASSGNLTGLSSILFFMGAIILLANIERAFNDIWGIAKLRAFKQRMMSYVFIMVVTPIFMALSLTILSMSQIDLNNAQWLANMPTIAAFLQSGFDTLMVYVFTVMLFTAVYYVMPNVQVKFQSALAGGIVAGVLFQSNTHIAALLVNRFTTNVTVYGSLAVIPTFMVCCLIAWTIVLLGAHVASSWGNVEGYRREFVSSKDARGFDETIALRLMLKIADNFRKDGSSTDYEVVGEQWSIPNIKLRSVLDKLESCELIHHLGDKQTLYVPGKELIHISVVDILSAVRFGKDGWKTLPDEGSDSDVIKINQLISKIHKIEEENLNNLTIDQLISKS